MTAHAVAGPSHVPIATATTTPRPRPQKAAGSSLHVKQHGHRNVLLCDIGLARPFWFTAHVPTALGNQVPTTAPGSGVPPAPTADERAGLWARRARPKVVSLEMESRSGLRTTFPPKACEGQGPSFPPPPAPKGEGEMKVPEGLAHIPTGFGDM